MWICCGHRHMLGKFWRSAKVTCQYPGHAGVKKRIQGRDVITLHVSGHSKAVWSYFSSWIR